MAKYVGKIFRVNNTALNIKRRGTHYVHVTWYNPFTRKFRCKVITSLEEEKRLSNNERTVLQTTPFHKKEENVYALFSRKKYNKLRNGKITPIPIIKTEGFGVWSGYQETRDVHINALKGKEERGMKIKK